MTAPTGARGPRVPDVPVATGVLGVGTDLVHVPGFAEQLARPGTVFAERTFTPRERREADRRAEASGSPVAEHLAARWAAKEAFVKAWSQALNAVAGRGVAPVIASEELDWREIEIVSDRWGRPGLRPGGRVAEAVCRTLGEGGAESGRWPVSLTHDGEWAAAVVLVLGGPDRVEYGRSPRRDGA